MSTPPTGILTLVFTDIQGSTALWERFGDDFQPILDLHHQVIRAQIEKCGGYEVKTEGDAFMIAFADPAPAIQFCTGAQTALHDAAWPSALVEDALPIEAARTDVQGDFHGLRVRMGAHTGRPNCTTDPNTGRMDYLGRMVNKASRLARAAHGGQILVSSRCWELALPRLGQTRMQISDLGEHTLRGIGGKHRLYAILPEALHARRFPPINTPRVRLTNLPEHSHRLVGREDELITVDDQLKSGARLITLLGPTGVGKRQLATAFGRSRQEHFAGGVWFCDLADAEDLDDICASVAVALGVTLNQADPVLQIGNALLGRGPVLLIMQGFDHLVEKAVESLMIWLSRAPDARALVTSSHPLLLEIEQIVPIDPLPAPPISVRPEDAAGHPAIGLMRTISGQPRAPTDELVNIARILDGIPLAMALTAARARHRSWPSIRAELEERFTPPEGKAPARADVLRTAISTAWDDLAPELALALAQLSVFRGDWSEGDALLGAGADSICAELARHGFLDARADGGWRMAPCIQEYATMRLSTSGPTALRDAETRHGQHFAKLTIPERLEALDGREGATQLRWLIHQRHNLRISAMRAMDRADPAVAGPTTAGWLTVLQWAGPPSTAARVASRTLALDDLGEQIRITLLRLRSLSHHAAGRSREAADDLGQALAISSAHPKLGAQVLLDMGNQASDLGNSRAALSHFEAALTAFADVSDTSGRGRALGALGNLSAKEGQLGVAQDLYIQALEIHRSIGNRREEAQVLSNLAIVTTIGGRTAEARELFRDALAIQRELGNTRAQAIVLGNLGDLFLEIDDLETARTHLEAALTAARSIGDRHIEGCFTGTMGEVAARDGHLPSARSQLARAERLLRETGDTYELIKLICRRGNVERLGRYPERALTCLDQAEALAASMGLDAESKPHQAILELRQLISP